MEFSKGIRALPLEASSPAGTKTICPALIWDEKDVILVDTGYPGQLPQFRQAFQQADIPLEKLTKIILTHHDIDHIGSLPAILQEVPHHVEVLAHPIEKPHIQGEKGLLKLTEDTIQQMKASPDEQQKSILSVLLNPPTARVDTIISGNEELPYCGGIVIIDTPGHTNGHISLYHKPSHTLIAGDAMHVIDGELTGPQEMFDFDHELAQKSLKNLTQFDIETVICYHGGLFNKNANEQIEELAK